MDDCNLEEHLMGRMKSPKCFVAVFLTICAFIIRKPGQKSEEVAMEVSYRGEARDRTTERK